MALSRGKRNAVAIGVVVVVFALSGAMWFLRALQRPLYEPGTLKVLTTIAPPQKDQSAQDWELEPGIRVRVHRSGAGPRVLVVHGGPGMPWKELPRGFTAIEGREFVAWDHRGCGESSRPIEKVETKNFWEAAKQLEARVGLSAQVADIERVRRVLGDEQVVVIGHSFGALLAALYASEFPEHVKALVFVAPADLIQMPGSENLFAVVGRHLEENRKAEYDSFVKRYLDFGVIFSKQDSEVAALNAQFGEFYTAAAKAKGYAVPAGGKPGGFMVHAAYLGLGFRHDWRPMMKQLTVPTLVVHGGKDLQSEGATRSFALAFPSADVQVIAGAGHFPFDDQPEAFAKLVGGFLAKVP